MNTKSAISPRYAGRLVERYGRWAVVTGASSGIGRAFAERLAQAGFSLVLVARRDDMLKAVAAELNAHYETVCHCVPVDLSQNGSASQLMVQTGSREVGLLVAAAGYGTSGPFLDSDLANERTMIDLNCGAVSELTHLYGQSMRARRRGAIILMSSLLAFQGVPRSANYAATKAFVQVLAEGLRPELRPFGIDVLAVAPGPIQSGFADRAGMTMSMSQGPDVVAVQALAALGRTGTVRPGWLSKLLEAGLAPLPRRLRTHVMQQVMAGMTP
ncbi:SDR family NAD(P)-dependent oxidoreductase [Devosia beringensis]|uniref:SDR family NAD(P)-dependent oxidoreductase n=1 Tax=Devosia beringensis TaxID=2657486 RepID=UPI00186B7C45|nr:SDR family NAD(P)-dependent oxidoreductase [Devosia beringensis]